MIFANCGEEIPLNWYEYVTESASKGKKSGKCTKCANENVDLDKEDYNIECEEDSHKSVFERAEKKHVQFKAERPKPHVADFFAVVKESAEDEEEGIVENAMTKYADADIKLRAMSSVLDWVNAGDYSYDALDGFILGSLDLDEDAEPDEDDNSLYSEIWASVADAMLTLDADESDVMIVLQGESDEDSNKAALRIGKKIADHLDENPMDDDDIVQAFAFGVDAVMECADEAHLAVYEGAVFEGFKNMLSRAGGFLHKVRKRVSGPVNKKLSRAMKKARRKFKSIFKKAAKLAVKTKRKYNSFSLNAKKH